MASLKLNEFQYCNHSGYNQFPNEFPHGYQDVSMNCFSAYLNQMNLSSSEKETRINTKSLMENNMLTFAYHSYCMCDLNRKTYQPVKNCQYIASDLLPSTDSDQNSDSSCLVSKHDKDLYKLRDFPYHVERKHVEGMKKKTFVYTCDYQN